MTQLSESKNQLTAQDREIRRVKDKRKRLTAAAAWERAVKRARHGVAPVLSMANAFEGGNVRGILSAAAYIRREDGGGEDPGTPHDARAGAVTACSLLERWEPQMVKGLLEGIEVGAEYYVTEAGDVDLGVNFSAGRISQLVALRLGCAREALRG